MVLRSEVRLFFVLAVVIAAFTRCGPGDIDSTVRVGRKPVLEPDYTDVTIPPNVAPMNFCIKEEGISFKVIARAPGSGFQITVNSRNGIVHFPLKAWKKLLKNSTGGKIEFSVYTDKKGDDQLEEFDPFFMNVSKDQIDPYLAYRLLYPGYYSWSHIRIMQRSIESFEEKPVFDNEIMDKNCANCHSFNQTSADRFMMHIRGSLGGTYFYDNGTITRVEPKIDAMPGGATYPSWHPGGRFVTFSSNQVRQSFYSVPEKAIEVFDLVSALIMYDRQTNETFLLTDKDTTRYLLTFPSWSPDGKYLYFCRARQIISGTDPQLEQIQETHYNLARRSFDPETRSFGETEIVFDAEKINKSVSFPRVSPDGRFLVFTLSDYGTFPIWHQEADLYMLNMQTAVAERMKVNSDRTDSYHTWSHNGRWLVFSSKRLDGRTTRPFFAHIDSLGAESKEFALPQKDPSLYSRMLESFNIPEFVNGRIKLNPRDLKEASKTAAIKAKPGNQAEADKAREASKSTVIKATDRPIHE